MIEEPTLSAGIADFWAAWELFRNPALAGMIGGATAGMLGVYVLVRRMVFFAAALSQIAGAGVALAFFVRLRTGVQTSLTSPSVFSLMVTALVTLWLAADRSVGGRRRDARLGIAFVLGSALTLVLGTRIVEELTDIDSLLFGSAVAVLPEDFTLLTVSCAVVMAIHLWLHRGFIAVCIDPEGAAVRGLPVKLINTVLLISLALVISVGTRILGALPIFAFSILPAMAALAVSSGLRSALVLAVVFGGASGFCGYLAAYLYDFPVGASQTLVAAAIVLLAHMMAHLRSRFAGSSRADANPQTPE